MSKQPEDRGVAGAVMDALWPILGGNHTPAEMWNEIGTAVDEAIKSYPVQPVAPWEPTHRHVRRGTEYMVSAIALTQTDRPIADYDKLVIYRGKAGDAWARPEEEFNDPTRFEKISPKHKA